MSSEIEKVSENGSADSEKTYAGDPTQFCVKPNKALPIRQDLKQGKI